MEQEPMTCFCDTELPSQNQASASKCNHNKSVQQCLDKLFWFRNKTYESLWLCLLETGLSFLMKALSVWHVWIQPDDLSCSIQQPQLLTWALNVFSMPAIFYQNVFKWLMLSNFSLVSCDPAATTSHMRSILLSTQGGARLLLGHCLIGCSVLREISTVRVT